MLTCEACIVEQYQEQCNRNNAIDTITSLYVLCLIDIMLTCYLINYPEYHIQFYKIGQWEAHHQADHFPKGQILLLSFFSSHRQEQPQLSNITTASQSSCHLANKRCIRPASGREFGHLRDRGHCPPSGMRPLTFLPNPIFLK
jgi:hypothetical protein